MVKRTLNPVRALSGALVILVCLWNPAQARRFNEAMKRIKPSVVRISISENGKDVSSGSGFVYRIGNRRRIVTAAHVVQDAKEIHVTVLDGKSGKALWLPAKLLGYSDQSNGADVAVLEVKGLPASARPAKTNKAPGGGGRLAAVGFPNGKFTVDAGHNLLNSERYAYTNGILAPGTSGGPTVNKSGEVVGVSVVSWTNTQTSKVEGRSVPIPIADAVIQRIVAGQTNNHGEIEHASVGIVGGGDASTADMVAMQNAGVPVRMARPPTIGGINKHSPAHGKLEPGDVVVGLSGKRLRSGKSGQLRQKPVVMEPIADNIAAATLLALPGRANSQIHYKVWRPGKKRGEKGRMVDVKIGKLPTKKQLNDKTIAAIQREGVRLALADVAKPTVKTNPQAFAEAEVKVPTKGVRLDAIPPGSALDRLKLQAGDVLFGAKLQMTGEGSNMPAATFPVRTKAEYVNLFVTPPPYKVHVHKLYILRDGHLKQLTPSEKKATLLNDELTATHAWPVEKKDK